MGPGFSNSGFSGFENRFELFEIMFFLVFALVIGIFVFIAVKSIRQWNKNNHSPRLTVPAMVVAKRINVSHHHHASTHHAAHSTSYYVTFQVESGDRMELRMTGQEYGMLIEGDHGNLTFQGTRYLNFERNI
jgi:hypothetical protein